MRATAPVALAAALLFAAPGAASADVIFDPADADELAAVLTEATADQGVCYGWDVMVDNVGVSEKSVGSNLGAGVPIDSSCAKWVELNVYITYTSESSESEDSASYDVESSPPAVTRADLDSLELDWDGLTGENPDILIGKAVTALPLLAADKGIAKPIEAAPQTGAAPADAQLTDDPGSDFWRDNGGIVLWGVGLVLAGGLFAWWVLRTNRTRQRRARPEPDPATTPLYIPDTVPEAFYQQPRDPDLAPAEKPAAKPEPDPEPTPEPAAEPAEPEPGPTPVELKPGESEPAAEPAEPEPGPTPVEPGPVEQEPKLAEPEPATKPAEPEPGPTPGELEPAEQEPEPATKPGEPEAGPIPGEPEPGSKPGESGPEPVAEQGEPEPGPVAKPEEPEPAVEPEQRAEPKQGESTMESEAAPERPAPTDQKDKE